MPTGNLVRLPTSLSQGGNTLTNLRGIVQGLNTFDYITSGFYPTVTDIVQQTSAFELGVGAWSSTIQYAYQPTSDSNSNANITYPSIVVSTTSATILFRVLAKSNAFTGAVFINGASSSPYSGFYVLYDTSNFQLFVEDVANFGYSNFNLNSSAVIVNTWYNYAIQLIADSGKGLTTVDVWENGIKQATQSINFAMQAPTGSTRLFNNENSNQFFYGKITDFTLLNGTPLTDAQMSAFTNAPFV